MSYYDLANAPIPFYDGKRCLVLGATGLIGSYVVRTLKASGATIFALTNQRQKNEYTWLAHELFSGPLSNLMDADNCRRVIAVCGRPSPDVVLSCAGITGGIGLAHTDPLGYVGPATAMAINILHACVQEKIPRLGFLSSTTVYPPSDCMLGENDAEGEIYPLYRGIGESKRYLEKLCAYYQEKTGIGVGIVRPSGAYGRYDNFNQGTSHVIPGMIDRAMTTPNDEPFEIWGDGKDVRDFIHAQDVAQGLLLAVAKSANSVPYNICSGTAITTQMLAENVLAAVGCPEREIVCNPEKPVALKTRMVSNRKAMDVLGFEPQIDLLSGLTDVVHWRRDGSK